MPKEAVTTLWNLIAMIPDPFIIGITDVLGISAVGFWQYRLYKSHIPKPIYDMQGNLINIGKPTWKESAKAQGWIK